MLALLLFLQIDQSQVDRAIERGCKALLGTPAEELKKIWASDNRHGGSSIQSHLEIVILTLAHAGYADTDPLVAPLLEAMIAKEIESTYTCSMQALALQYLGAKKYQWRIAQCAQYLLDNQLENGQWDYGNKTDVSHIKPGDMGAAPKKGGKTEVLPSFPVKKKRTLPAPGDNSNSQYACLGLRACIDAGIAIDREVLTKARDWWIQSQMSDGGWGYGIQGETPYGSMTVGGVGSICITKHFLGENFKNDGSVKKGLDWLAKNWTVESNPRQEKNFWHYYYLYGLERAGILCAVEKIGAHEWYVEGATYLLKNQWPNGSWGKISDTCFAILFLRRGMKPLLKIATGVK